MGEQARLKTTQCVFTSMVEKVIAHHLTSS